MKPGQLIAWLLLIAADARAHRLDEYLQAVRVAVATNHIVVSIELTPGVAIAGQLLAVIDRNRDGQCSVSEQAEYLQTVLKDIRVRLDEKALALNLADTSFPTVAAIQSGVGVICVNAVAKAGEIAAGKHTLSLTNAHLPTISVYQVNALRPKDSTIQITKQTRDELQKDYQMEFSIGPAR